MKGEGKVTPNKWYSKDEVRSLKLLGEHSYRIDSFARRVYRLLTLNENDLISGSSLLELQERLRRGINLRRVAEEVGVRNLALQKNYSDILWYYIENIFPKTRRGYSPLYVLREGCNYEDLIRDLKEAVEKRDEIAITIKPDPEDLDKDEASTKEKFLEELVIGLVREISCDKAVIIEELAARKLGYKGKRYVPDRKSSGSQNVSECTKRGTIEESEIVAGNEINDTVPDDRIGDEDTDYGEEIQRPAKKKRGQIDNIKVGINLGKNTVVFAIEEKALERYLKNEDITRDEFERIDASLLRGQLEMALRDTELKEEMRIQTKGYDITIDSGVITSLM